MNTPVDTDVECAECGEAFPVQRYRLGYRVCLACGDQQARDARRLWCVVPMHKSNYTLVSNRNDLIGVNNKGGIVRAD